MNLYAFVPDSHGPHSFFVAAPNEQAARQAVELYIAQDKEADDGYICYAGWPKRYQMLVCPPGEVIASAND